ncbi:MAG: tRNA (adenosine(37)-N6)-threonylcarbamoyltransferase complex ATPase subunit type 1 TsaE [Boseongicola sp.]|nr:MAG: tRNA (adenosine(37)-N6)-threonylcarbamoyltransferase complex ATPase subunit type 1 TsaE [Boseongicola sp.]
MSSERSVELCLKTPDETAQAAGLLAPLLRAGDCVLLDGNLGTGKTHFARALIQKRLEDAGLWEEVPSPTYTLVQIYNDGLTEIWHSDLYRLHSTEELVELGLDVALDTAITLIEWPDRLGELTPKNALQLKFQMNGQGRSLHATWSDTRLNVLMGVNA